MMSYHYSADSCIIYRIPFADDPNVKPVRVSKGVDMLIKCSLERDDTELHEYLKTDPSAVYVHEPCRRRYIDVPKQTIFNLGPRL